jgi:pyruvate/2-oxoglutarate dehydrogenase complex dihydrolipoamide acyltransferase (E2) component
MGGKTKSRYRYVGTYADTLGNGQPVEPGEFVTLSEEDLEQPDNARFIEEEKLISVDEAADPKATDAASELARKEGIELTAVSATGADGSITVDDVKQAVASREAASEQPGEEG